MATNRLFNGLIAVALVLVVSLTIWQSVETTKVVSAAGQQNEPARTACFSEIERLSLEAVFVEGVGWASYTNQGPTGVDGGLLELLSNSRSCSIRKEN
jgi:hypothetical protein